MQLAVRTSSFLLLLGSTLLAFSLIACGGDDDRDSEAVATSEVSTSATATSTADAAGGTSVASTRVATAAATSTGTPTAATNDLTARAQALAHSGMLDGGELPGTGWNLVGVDQFDDDDDDDSSSSFDGIPECQVFQDSSPLGPDDNDNEALGRAKKEFKKAGGGGVLPSSVEIEVAVYRESWTREIKTAAALAFMKQVFASKVLDDCYARVFASDEKTAAAGLRTGLTRVDFSAPMPHGGTGFAYDLAIGNAALTFHVRLELYLWRNEDALVSVLLTATPDKSVELATTIVTKVDDQLTAAQR